ncbi:DivIVA domain-containing protein [Microbacterium sp.]|uniref:DivIVA domain-containing protein n=1 Tax=Microbacterium sp. TaxID=51671 RepID=UPI001AD41DFB|nr:DivIVA domain-containing protein [Microbacterium sp.]MBN9156829.1 DivIVA domain-containing protein [Microbacterium sp.]
MDSAELASTTLPRSRFRDGFAIDEVDALLDQCVTALRDLEQGRSTPLSTHSIIAKQFRHVRFGKAYDADAVDDLLDSVVARMRELRPEPDSAVPYTPSPEDAARAQRGLLLFKVLAGVAVAVGIAMAAFTLFGG